MSIRASAVGVALLALLTAAIPQRALAWDLWAHVARSEDNALRDILITVQETRSGHFLPGVGVNADTGLTGSIVIDERNFMPACPFLPAYHCEPCPCPAASPEHLRCRRDLMDCFLTGIHPAAAFLRTRCFVEFDDADALPVLTVGQQRVRAGALMCGAAETASGVCFRTGMLVAGCRQLLATPPASEPTVPDAAPPAPRNGHFSLRLSPAEFSIDINLGQPLYERLAVRPVEVEELTVPPAEIELLPVMPVVPELVPFLPPERGAYIPDGGTVLIGGGLRVRVPCSEPQRAPVVTSTEFFVVGTEVEIEQIPVPPVEVPAVGKVKKTEKAQRCLRRAEKCFLAGRHDEARELFERVQRLCPGTEHERQARERLTQLAAKEIMDRVTEGVGAAQREEVPVPRVAPESESYLPPRFLQYAPGCIPPSPLFPLPCELAGMEAEQAREAGVAREVAKLLKACEQAVAEGRCCEALDLARKAQILSPKRVAAHPLAKELGLMPQAEIELLVPRLPAVDPKIVPALEQIMTQQLREMVTPRLIIEVEEQSSEEQEKREAPGEAEVPRFFVEPPQRLSLEEEKGCPVCDEMRRMVVRLLDLLGPGVCLDLDCHTFHTRARGQMQLGALKVRVLCGGGRFDLNLDVTPATPVPTTTARSWYLRWLDGAEESEPDRN